MKIPTAPEILTELLSMQPQPTSKTPANCRGIYGLVDHTGTLRYIGSTSAESESFRKRIHHRHRTGSETHSHYFSRMYNTGRMYRLRNNAATYADGRIAKKLRNDFIAEHCGAVWVPLPDTADIAGLEAQVIALAPPEAVAWNGRTMETYPEPIALVDALIKRLALSPVERAALSRQKARYENSMNGGVETAVEQHAAGAMPPLPHGRFRFFALDVETANHDRGSICQIGVACVRPDDSIETWVTLIDPGTRQWVFTDLHGIDFEMVQGAPTINAVLAVLEPMLNGQTVYQHSGFDRSAIRSACLALARDEPDWDWQNSVSVARSAWPELKGNGGHGLASLKSHLDLSFEHHDAGEDARAAAQVVLLAEKTAAGPKGDTVEAREEVTITATAAVVEVAVTGTVIGRSILTPGNLKNNHFYLRKFLTAFPESAIDASKDVTGNTQMLTVEWSHGVSSITDICGRHKFFRDRSSTRAFFERTGAQPGDIVEVTRIACGRYSLALQRA
jgi:DNA polymerase III subunit epsilon